jgi:radical SAM superfamily enzyme YgiQ (UPF0313 family)
MIATANVSTDNAAFDAYCARLRQALPANGRLLLIQIPQVILGSFNRDIALKRGYYAFPPTGLQYLYEAIKHRRLDVRILDLNYELLKRVFEQPDFDVNDWPVILEEVLDEFDPGIVGVSCLFDLAIKPMLEVLRRVRRRGRAVVVAGGVIATYEWKSLLSPDLAHFVVRGEGENKLNFLLDHLTGADLESVATPGIVFSDDDFHETGGAPDVVDVHGSLVDSYALVPIETYNRYGSLNPYSRQTDSSGHPFAAIQMSRGCRAQCTFCAVRDFMGQGVRARSVDDLMAEMAFLYESKGVRHFEWLDDDLLFHRREIKDLLRRIIAKGWDIRWSANNGLIAASVDDELMDLIERSGCVGFKVGIETGNEEMLKKVKKPGKHSKFLEFSRLLDRHPGPFVGGNFIVGLPDETFGQMMDSFRFAVEIDLDWAAFTVCQTIRGASAFSDAGEYFEHQMKTGGAAVANFIPARESTQGHVQHGSGVARNLDIFRLPADTIPSAEQVKEIWFAFNVIVNYVCNKNLRPGGRPHKFVAWVGTAQRAYPTNPYMTLFLALGRRLMGDDEAAEQLVSLARRHVATEYWQDRFAAFRLDHLLADFPSTPDATHTALAALHTQLFAAIGEWLALPRGRYPGSPHRQATA